MQPIFDIFRHYNKINPHKNASLSNEQTYIDFRTREASAGFLITVPTKPGTKYQLEIKGLLESGDKVFLHLESTFDNKRIIDRSLAFQDHNTKYEFIIQFQSESSLINLGLLSWSTDPTTHLKITKCTIHPIIPSDTTTPTTTPNPDPEAYSEPDRKSDFECDSDSNLDDLIEPDQNMIEENPDQNSVSIPINIEYLDDNQSNFEIKNKNDLPELLPSQFIIPFDLDELEKFNDFDIKKINKENKNKDIKKINKENKNKEIKEIKENFEKEIKEIKENFEKEIKENKENKENFKNEIKENKEIKENFENEIKKIKENKENKEIKENFDEEDLYDSGRQIDLDEDIKLMDLGFSRILKRLDL
ncbi:MAG: hypothetical protein WD512_01870 [Candidatus Paceibacterota bacterium]